TFATFALPSYSMASWSRTGATMRQGAHQVAQKSTTARPLCCSIWVSKSASFTSTAFDIFYSPNRRIPRGASSVSLLRDVGDYLPAVEADRRPSHRYI